MDAIALAWPGAPIAIASLLAGLLYLGSGIGLGAAQFMRRRLSIGAAEAPVRRSDLPCLVMVGARWRRCRAGAADVRARPDVAAASLLLNLEGLATMAIAWVVLRENVDRRILLGALAILAGAALLSWHGGPSSIGWGALLIAAACLARGIDNNLTRKLSSADPIQIAMLKGFTAGAVNFGLALAQGAVLPSPGIVLWAGPVGFLGYGVSLTLFVLALRHLGAARTSAYFSTAPLIGGALAVMLFGEPITTRLLGPVLN